MRLRDLIEAGVHLAPEAVAQICDRVEADWAGVRVYVTLDIAQFKWRRRRSEPRGGVERLVRDVETTILSLGGSREDVDRVMTGIAGGYVWV